MSEEQATSADLVIVSATPGGIMAAIGAARSGHSAIILSREKHIGGLPGNGLGATDIATRGGTGGLFMEFVERVRSQYEKKYGKDSKQYEDCSDGYHFEPSVAERIFEEMLAEYPSVKVLKLRQFDAKAENVVKVGKRLTKIAVTNLETKQVEWYTAKVFVDATYEGDLSAAAGAPFRTGRESIKEFNEPLAGKVYKKWAGPVGEGSTGEGDEAIQSYNYRVCLTDQDANKIAIEKPAHYNREEFASLVGDVKSGLVQGIMYKPAGVVNPVTLPNGKTDSNNHHGSFISTDLPEENWPWPTADWKWRDQFAVRLKEYTLGLLYFAQHDAELPEDFRKDCLKWGLAKDEYQDNENFPRQVYVREGRRIMGEHLFTAHDSLPVKEGARPPVYASSITASHYAIDSHAVHKREPGRCHLDGFLSMANKPYTVPYGVIVPKEVDGLLAPVPISATHMGFGTLRMEPCWMAMGQAAGVAAHVSISTQKELRSIDTSIMQDELLKQHAILIYFKDVKPSDTYYDAVQYVALRGGIPEWTFNADKAASAEDAKAWSDILKVTLPDSFKAGETKRGELLKALYDQKRGVK